MKNAHSQKDHSIRHHLSIHDTTRKPFSEIRFIILTTSCDLRNVLAAYYITIVWLPVTYYDACKDSFVVVLCFADKLLRLLRNDLHDPSQRTIVFCNTTESCDFVGHFLTDKRIKFIRLHSSLPSKVIIKSQAYRKLG